MRIHTDVTHDRIHAYGPLDVEVRAQVTGSRTRDRALSVQLVGHGVRHTRKANTGTHGAGQEYAATYDDWGVFLAELFDHDPDAVVGSSAKNAIYDGRDDFHAATAYKYDTTDARYGRGDLRRRDPHGDIRSDIEIQR